MPAHPFLWGWTEGIAIDGFAGRDDPLFFVIVSIYSNIVLKNTIHYSKDEINICSFKDPERDTLYSFFLVSSFSLSNSSLYCSA